MLNMNVFASALCATAAAVNIADHPWVAAPCVFLAVVNFSYAVKDLIKKAKP